MQHKHIKHETQRPTLVLDDMDIEDLRFLFERRRHFLLLAKRVNRSVKNQEEAYRKLCEDNHIDYIPVDVQREYQLRVKQLRMAEKVKRYICHSCNEPGIVISQLCPNCEEYKQGFRVKAFCIKCGYVRNYGDDLQMVKDSYVEFVEDING